MIIYRNTKGGFTQDVREWYAILEKLYRTKVKTPLWPVEFFLEAYRQGVARYLLIRMKERSSAEL